MSRIVVIGALPESLLIFRGDLLKALVNAGHDVTGMAAETNHALVRQLASIGVGFRAYPVQRNGMNPLKDAQTYLALRKVLRDLRPDSVLSYTIKPVVWGGIAAKGVAGSRFYALITGLGFAFQPGGCKQRILNGLVTCLYHWSLISAKKVIFQNKNDLQLFVGRKIVDERRCIVVDGSGVNLDHYVASPLPTGNMAFLMIARLLGSKGLREYAKAAQLVHEKYPHVTFHLVGPEDPSPDGLPLSEVRNWQASGVLQYMGATADVRPFIKQCHILVLPSYHEGMPRTVLEAMSMGRAIITTDAPGCRETIRLTHIGLKQKVKGEPVMDGENGFLVPVKDVLSLAHAMERFILHPELVETMGRCSRRIAEERFDVHKVNGDMLRTMALI